MNKKNKSLSENPFHLLNKEVSDQMNAIAKAIENHKSTNKTKLDTVKLAIEIMGQLDSEGFKILKSKEKKYLFVNKED